MFISIGRNGDIALGEPRDFKRLHIAPADATMSIDAIRVALSAIAGFDGDNAWIDVQSLKALSGCADDPAWTRDFDAMIASVGKFGWLSPDGKRVRCHVKVGAGSA